MTAKGTLVTVTRTCAARPARYSDSCAWMLWAVAAASPCTTRSAGTTVIAKAPPRMLMRYRRPAVLASRRGEAPVTEPITVVPRLVARAVAGGSRWAVATECSVPSSVGCRQGSSSSPPVALRRHVLLPGESPRHYRQDDDDQQATGRHVSCCSIQRAGA